MKLCWSSPGLVPAHGKGTHWTGANVCRHWFVRPFIIIKRLQVFIFREDIMAISSMLMCTGNVKNFHFPTAAQMWILSSQWATYKGKIVSLQLGVLIDQMTAGTTLMTKPCGLGDAFLASAQSCQSETNINHSRAVGLSLKEALYTFYGQILWEMIVPGTMAVHKKGRFTGWWKQWHFSCPLPPQHSPGSRSLELWQSKPGRQTEGYKNPHCQLPC